MRVLVLGGSSEASALARALAGRGGVEALLSLAGATKSPAPSPIPRRIGGFGGAAGLAGFLREGRYGRLVDATHPFAARISANAAQAAREAGVDHAIFTRGEWLPGPGDHWREVDAIEAALAALGPARKRVLLAVGGAGLDALARDDRHDWIVRSIDRPVA
ncbi:MAG: precorrin-6A/cobalt-precorrin-6A reductase, partial [Hyphomicrobiales bacterium]|nr:precorrin-6A/cobalt-precorrin-6A reductase [Hyphomicrobiales bacterium]